METIQNYYDNNFYIDIQKMSFTKPNNILINSNDSLDENSIFFGGRNWENYENDTKNIQEKELFALCLFALVCTDLTMFKYYNVNYNSFRLKQNTPKFGWVGFGPHFEDPKKILAHNNESIFEKVRNILPDFIDIWFSQLDSCLDKNISPKDFLGSMLNDKAFGSITDIIIIQEIKQLLEKKIK